jgi:hypothetical protein
MPNCFPSARLDQCIEFTRAFVQAIDDPRDPDLTGHTFLEMVRARVYDRNGRGRRIGRPGA